MILEYTSTITGERTKANPSVVRTLFDSISVNYPFFILINSVTHLFNCSYFSARRFLHKQRHESLPEISAGVVVDGIAELLAVLLLVSVLTKQFVQVIQNLLKSGFSMGPLAHHPLARSHAPLTRALAPPSSLRSFAHSLAPKLAG